MDLSERTRHILGQAHDEARRLGDEHVGTDHLLLAMLRDAQGAAAYVLADYGIDYDGIFSRMAGEPASLA